VIFSKERSGTVIPFVDRFVVGAGIGMQNYRVRCENFTIGRIVAAEFPVGFPISPKRCSFERDACPSADASSRSSTLTSLSAAKAAALIAPATSAIQIACFTLALKASSPGMCIAFTIGIVRTRTRQLAKKGVGYNRHSFAIRISGEDTRPNIAAGFVLNKPTAFSGSETTPYPQYDHPALPKVNKTIKPIEHHPSPRVSVKRNQDQNLARTASRSLFLE
jgi:hypothetical protein